MIAIALSSFFLLVLNIISFNNKTKLIENTLSLLCSILAIGVVWLPFVVYQDIHVFPLILIILCVTLFFLQTLFDVSFLTKVGVALIALISLFFFKEQIRIYEYEIETNNVFLLGLFMISLILLNPIAEFGDRLLKIIFDSDVYAKSFILFILYGIVLLTAYFKFSFFGLACVLSALILHSYMFNLEYSVSSSLMLFVSLAFGFWLMSTVYDIGLFEGATLFTFFNTIGLYFFFKKFSETVESIKLYFAILFIVSILMCVPLFLGLLYPMFGGTQYFVFLILIISMFHFWSPWKPRETTFLFSILTFVGVVFYVTTDIPNLSNRNIEFKNSSISSTNENFKNSSNKSLSGLDGNYIIKESPVIFNFELGPKNSRTKGVFKDVSGTITIGESITDSKFEITIPVAGLSTGNNDQVEALMEEDFFNLKKFPLIKFKSTSFKSTPDYYELIGTMTMLGVQNELRIKLKYEKTELIDEFEYLVFSGVGSIDRVLFGMESDASIGNLVDFNFKILLEKV